MNQLSDVLKNYDQVFPEASEKKINELLNVRITLSAWKPMIGGFGEYVCVLCYVENAEAVYFNTGSKVIMDKLNRLAAAVRAKVDDKGITRLPDGVEASIELEKGKKGNEYYNMV